MGLFLSVPGRFWSALRRPEQQREVFRFVLAGMLNTAVGYGIYACGVLLGLAPSLALAIAFIFGSVFNYFSTGRIAFGARSIYAFPRFIAAYVALYLFNVTLLYGLRQLNLNALLSQAIALPPTVICTFVVMKLFVFRA